MKKILYIGTVPPDRGTTQREPLFLRIETERGYLSFSGVIGPKRNGDAAGSCGQIDMQFAHRDKSHDDARYEHPTRAAEIEFAARWDASLWLDVLDLWHAWHLKNVADAPADVLERLAKLPAASRRPAWV